MRGEGEEGEKKKKKKKRGSRRGEKKKFKKWGEGGCVRVGKRRRGAEELANPRG